MSSKTSCFHAFVIVSIVKTTQGATKMFYLDAHEGQISKALTRFRALYAATALGLRYFERLLPKGRKCLCNT